MKRFLLSISVALTASAASAQCADVFMSEMIEGWSNNKAIEIYNPTASAIDLTSYGIVRFQNGSSTPGSASYMSGLTVQPHDVVVIVLDKRDTAGTGLEAPVWDELLAAADYWMNPTYDNGIWPMYFNGNDAVALVKNNGGTLVDLFGKIGEGTGFGGWNNYGLDDLGNPMYMSQDHTLIRKNTVTGGVTVPPTSFDVTAQWDTLSANTFDHLGTHACDCFVGVNELFSEGRNVRMFPNPASGDYISVIAEKGIESIRISSVNGAVVREINHINDRMHKMDVAGLPSGVLVIEFIMRDGTIVRQRLIH
jgi:Lamin Tail Domain